MNISFNWLKKKKPDQEEDKKDRRKIPGRRKEDFLKVTDLEQEVSAMVRTKILAYDTIVANYYTKKRKIRQEFVVTQIKAATDFSDQLKNILNSIYVGLSLSGFEGLDGEHMESNTFFNSLEYKFYTSLIEVLRLIVLNALCDDIRDEKFIEIQDVTSYLDRKWKSFRSKGDLVFTESLLNNGKVPREKIDLALRKVYTRVRAMLDSFYLNCIEKANYDKVKFNELEEQMVQVREQMGLDLYSPLTIG